MSAALASAPRSGGTGASARRWGGVRAALRALGGALLTVLAVATLSFALLRAARGGPFDADQSLPPGVEQAVRARYHLDWPLWRQYLHYLGPFNLDRQGLELAGGDGSRRFGGLLALDFGPSYVQRDASVNDVVAQSLPISFALGALALAWAVPLGLWFGVRAAARAGSRFDLAVRLLATAGVALPSFLVATLLLLVFALWLDWLPVAGQGGLEHLVMPALALGAPVAAYVARLVRAGLLEVLSQDWIRSARAKGLSEEAVLWRHALRPALLPVVAYLGPAAAGVLTGSLAIERIFAIPGLGSHFVNAALSRDYTLAGAVAVLYAALVCALNALVDGLQAWLDPRLRNGAR